MLLSRRLDDKEIQLKNQSLIFFQISGAGHEAHPHRRGPASAAGYDWFYPYYRDRALCLTLGMTPLEMLLAAVGAKDDPDVRRTADAVALGHRKLNIPSQGSPTGTQCLQAVGCAEAALHLRAHHGHPRSRRALSRRRDHLHLDRRRARRARASSGSR